MILNTNELIEIISGRRHDAMAIAVRFTLGLMTPFYRLAVGWRNRRFDASKNFHRVSAPVISIGNLTTGGTGKTPLVLWMCKLLRSENLRVALISRGYGKQNTDVDRNDEALELENRLPDIPHLQNPDRHQAALAAIKELNSQVIVLDDGFQHRRLARDLDIVLIDATQPFGFDRLLPRGLLREPVSSLARADAIVLTRSDAIDDQTRQKIRRQVAAVNADVTWAETRTVANRFLQFDGSELDLSQLAGKSVFAFCGIGNPQGFAHTLDQLNLEVLSQQNFGDHHGYSPGELKRLGELAALHKAAAIICTHKDLVKVGVNRLNNIPVYALVIDTEFIAGEDGLVKKIKDLFLNSPAA